MRKLILVVALITGVSESVLAKPFQVITYNTALARAYGHDFVPCVLGRLEGQKQNVWRKSEIPTVFAFQEVFYQDAYDDLKAWAQKNDLNITASNTRRNGLVVVSEFKIKNEELHVFSCNAFAQNRGVLEAKIEVDGVDVRILNSHTSDSEGETPNSCQTQQLKQVSAVASRDSEIPSILAGDFNAGPDLKIIEQQYNPIEKIWEPFKVSMDGWQRALSEEKGVTWDTDKNPIARPGPQLNSTLDHVFVNQGVEIQDFELMYQEPVAIPNCNEYEVEAGKTFLSDHFGVKARVELHR